MCVQGKDIAIAGTSDGQGSRHGVAAGRREAQPILQGTYLGWDRTKAKEAKSAVPRPSGDGQTWPPWTPVRPLYPNERGSHWPVLGGQMREGSFQV